MAVRIELEQDPPLRVNAEEGDTILASMLRAGVDFPHDCQAGNCGTCKCELVSGEISELPYSEFALDAEERARDLILACRSQVWSDCVIRPLSEDDSALHPSRIMQCEVLEITALTPEVRGVKLAIKSGGPYTFSAGQHALLEFTPGVSAHYAMANRPVDALLQFYIQHHRDDAAAQYAHGALRIGERVTVSGPYGQNYLRDNHRGAILAIAEAGAFAAVCSIMETALTSEPQRAVTLYVAAASQRDAFFEERLRQLAAQHANFKYHVVLSECDDASCRRGELAQVLRQDALDVGNAKAYIAASPGTVAAVRAYLVRAGMSERDIHTDTPQRAEAAP